MVQHIISYLKWNIWKETYYSLSKVGRAFTSFFMHVVFSFPHYIVKAGWKVFIKLQRKNMRQISNEIKMTNFLGMAYRKSNNTKKVGSLRIVFLLSWHVTNWSLGMAYFSLRANEVYLYLTPTRRSIVSNDWIRTCHIIFGNVWCACTWIVEIRRAAINKFCNLNKVYIVVILLLSLYL